MTTNRAQPDPGAKDSALQFPATSALVSGHDTAFVNSESLDARTFAEFERYGEQPSWERQRGAG